MTDDSDPKDWSPEDGAGYIPTEEKHSDPQKFIEQLRELEQMSWPQMVIEGSENVQVATAGPAIPIGELEALADEWDGESDNNHDIAIKIAKSSTGSRRFPEGMAVAFEKCAQELREIIAEYE